MNQYPPPATYQQCPRCGFQYEQVPPSCPKCKLFNFAAPLTDKQRHWNKFGLYVITVPGLVLATIPVAWFGTFLVEAFTAGDKFETGGTAATKLVDNHAWFVAIGIVASFSWLAYRYALNKPDVKALMGTDVQSQESIPRLIAIEMVALNLLTIAAFLFWTKA